MGAVCTSEAKGGISCGSGVDKNKGRNQGIMSLDKRENAIIATDSGVGAVQVTTEIPQNNVNLNQNATLSVAMNTEGTVAVAGEIVTEKDNKTDDINAVVSPTIPSPDIKVNDEIETVQTKVEVKAETDKIIKNSLQVEMANNNIDKVKPLSSKSVTAKNDPSFRQPAANLSRTITEMNNKEALVVESNMAQTQKTKGTSSKNFESSNKELLVEKTSLEHTTVIQNPNPKNIPSLQLEDVNVKSNLAFTTNATTCPSLQMNVDEKHFSSTIPQEKNYYNITQESERNKTPRVAAVSSNTIGYNVNTLVSGGVDKCEKIPSKPLESSKNFNHTMNVNLTRKPNTSEKEVQNMGQTKEASNHNLVTLESATANLNQSNSLKVAEINSIERTEVVSSEVKVEKTVSTEQLRGSQTKTNLMSNKEVNNSNKLALTAPVAVKGNLSTNNVRSNFNPSTAANKIVVAPKTMTTNTIANAEVKSRTSNKDVKVTTENLATQESFKFNGDQKQEEEFIVVENTFTPRNPQEQIKVGFSKPAASIEIREEVHEVRGGETQFTPLPSQYAASDFKKKESSNEIANPAMMLKAKKEVSSESGSVPNLTIRANVANPDNNTFKSKKSINEVKEKESKNSAANNPQNPFKRPVPIGVSGVILKINPIFYCSICKDLYNEIYYPVILSCNHSICVRCFEKDFSDARCGSCKELNTYITPKKNDDLLKEVLNFYEEQRLGTYEENNLETINSPGEIINIKLISEEHPAGISVKIVTTSEETLAELKNRLIEGNVYNPNDETVIFFDSLGTEISKEFLPSLSLKSIMLNNNLKIMKQVRRPEVKRNSLKRLTSTGINVENLRLRLQERKEKMEKDAAKIDGIKDLKAHANLDRRNSYSYQNKNIMENLEKLQSLQKRNTFTNLQANFNNLFKDKSDLNKVGIALYADGKFQEAESYYRQALEIDPLFKAAYNNLGNALRKQKRYLEALECYYQVLKIDPKCKEAYNGIGNTLDVQKQFTQAIENYKKAIEIDPKYKGAFNNMGNAYENMKNYEDAMTNYEKALEIDPRDKIAQKNFNRCKSKLDEKLALNF